MTGKSVWSRLVGDFVSTVLRWRDVDYRLLFGGAIVLALLLFRLAAFGIDVDSMEIYQPREATSGWVKSVENVSPNCRDAPGYLLGTDRNGRSLAKTLVV